MSDSGSGSVCQSCDFFVGPNVIGDSCSHRWRDPQRLVNSRKVVVDEVQGNRSCVVLALL